jgi:transcriptional regulator with PAS, ATPase and Fis domain
MGWLRMIADHSAAAIATARAFEQIEALKAKLELENEYLREEVTRAGAFGELIGQGPALEAVTRQIDLVAPTDAAVLILGESGTGKELVARGLHYGGPRRDMPFVEINCAAITETLFESELFGHEKGAFTDAKATKKGLVELADRGTLFLDEVSEMSLGSQAKFLRCLQERVFKRVGGTRDIKVDLRVISATNRPLEGRVKEGLFREDLFYRLNVIPIVIPPLRERRDDILPMARHFLAEASQRFHKGIKEFEPETERLFLSYSWPGNVRELKNLIERLVILGTSITIAPEHLPLQFAQHTPSPELLNGSSDRHTLAEVERAYISLVMQKVEANKSKAAKILGISRQTLRKKLTGGLGEATG